MAVALLCDAASGDALPLLLAPCGAEEVKRRTPRHLLMAAVGGGCACWALVLVLGSGHAEDDGEEASVVAPQGAAVTPACTAAPAIVWSAARWLLRPRHRHSHANELPVSSILHLKL